MPKLRTTASALLLLAFCALNVSSAPGPDTDGDGISDAAEEILGGDPSYPDQLLLLHEDHYRDQGDNSVSTEIYRPGCDFGNVYFGNLGGDRFCWRIDFAGDFEPKTTVLHLYVNSDADANTGRRASGSIGGTDYMLSLAGGNPRTGCYAPDGTQSSAAPPRFFVDDNRVYVSYDLSLRQLDGRSDFQLYILCHEAKKPGEKMASDQSAGFRAIGSAISRRRKAVPTWQTSGSRNIETTWGVRRIRRIMADSDNLVLKALELDADGFEVHHFTEYRDTPLDRRGYQASITGRFKAKGTFHVGVVMQDGAGAEPLALELSGKRIATIVAHEDDAKSWLYFTKKAYPLDGETEVTARVLWPEGGFRTTALLLLKHPPEPRKRCFEIRHLAAKPVLDGKDSLGAYLAWVTTWPADCTVEYGETDKLGNGAAAEPQRANHHLRIGNLTAGQTLFYRVSTKRPDGAPVASPLLSMIVQPPALREESFATAGIPLRVVNTCDAECRNWPVTSGVPFPQGMLWHEDRVRLDDDKGKEIPLQRRVLCRWPDNSIKWLLLDFQADVPAASETTCHLVFGRDVRPARLAAHVVEVRATNSCTEIGTGPLAVKTQPDSAGIMQNIRLDLNRDGSFSEDELASRGCRAVLSAGGKRYTSRVEEVNVEDAGPLRATVRIGGSFLDEKRDSFFRFTARLHAYAGHDFFVLDFTFENDNEAEKFSEFDSIALELPCSPGGEQRYALGGVDSKMQKLAAPVRLFQRFEDSYELGAPDQTAKHEGKAAGWCSLAGSRFALTAAVRNFWQQYPKAFSIEPGMLRVELCPDFEAGPYDAFPFEKEQHKLYYYLLNGHYKIRTGVTKNHRIVLDFGSPGDEGAGDAAALLNRRPLAVAPPDWCCSSKTFYDVCPQDAKRFAMYEESAEQNMKTYVDLRERHHDFGMLNFGDWYGERKVNWGNIEYDTQHAFFLHFIRSGDPAFFFPGEEAELHNRDVDTVWHGKDAGKVHVHSIGHTGGYYARGPEGLGIPRGGFTVSHTWTEGHVEHYFLTGDARSLEAGVKIAEYFDGAYLNNYDFSNCRVPGWHLILTMALYNATYDEYYLNAARIIVQRVVERWDPDSGGWPRQLVPGHCHCMPRCHGNAMFMVAILLSGLKYYHRTTGDPRIPEIIIKGAKYMVAEGWDDQNHGFRYTSCPKTRAGWGAAPLMLEGVAYAAALSGDSELRRIARDGVAASLSGSAYGKSWSFYYRCGPRYLFDAAGLDFTLNEALRKEPTKFKPPAWLSSAKPGEVVLIQAEDFTDQGGGEVKTMTGRWATHGSMVTYWHKDIGHWLEWAFSLPEAGKYQVALRYATGCTNTHRDFMIDGRHPADCLKDFHLPFTGGFSSEADNWRYLILGEPGGKPAILDLPAGEHIIRMTNLSDGLGLDFIVLKRVD